MPRENVKLRAIFAADHKSVGARFLWLALLCVVLGMALSLSMRLQLSRQDAELLSAASLPAQQYEAMMLVHGTLMVFFVLTAAPQCGFGYFLLPLQIGAREMAFPLLSGLSFWMALASLAGFLVSLASAQSIGMTVWLVSVACFCAAMILASLNICVTAIDSRAKGMTLPRLPVTVWAWLVTSILSLLIFSILLASSTLLIADRFAGTQFFSLSSMPAAARPFLWQRWFWFFAQAEVYVAMLPCFGIVTHVLAIYARRKLWGEREAVLGLCATGLSGFCIWGEHMFSSGLNPYTPLAFSMLASSLGFPALLLIVCWIRTLWGGKPRLDTAMLFALGFVALFLSGGISGIFMARWAPTGTGSNDALVTGHFHLVMGVAATFAILAALFFWFPKIFGRRLNETLGRIHFWITLAGVYVLFMPMHWLGLLQRENVLAGAGSLEHILKMTITVATTATISAQILFFCNFFWSLWRGEKSDTRNPWRAATLEWFVDSPPQRENFDGGMPVVFRGAYEFGARLAGEDFVPQHLAPERIAKLP
jgi:cytochrome c oxidase subunit 1